MWGNDKCSGGTHKNLKHADNNLVSYIVLNCEFSNMSNLMYDCVFNNAISFFKKLDCRLAVEFTNFFSNTILFAYATSYYLLAL